VIFIIWRKVFYVAPLGQYACADLAFEHKFHRIKDPTGQKRGNNTLVEKSILKPSGAKGVK
jgi:hypothetical protein